tara:strand:- start:22865 stop:23467 length:603 start_codon:yes stop_codon:yes gene_type:complete
MAVIDTVTIGTDSWSVYALVLTEAIANTDSFWAGRLGAESTAWAAATANEKIQAVVTAADWMDRALIFTGTKTVATQDRAWPRDNAANSCDDTTVASGTTPDAIFDAQSWLAGSVLVSTAAAAAATQGSNIKSAKAGSAEVVFFKPTLGTGADVRLPQVAHDYTKCFTQSAANISGPTITGTGTASSFCANDFGLDSGLS